MNRLEEYFGRDASLSDEKTTHRFRKRYALGLWMAVLPFFGFFAALLISIRLNGDLLAFAACWIFGLLLLAYVALIYRCPRCGTVPKSKSPGTTGVLIFPRRCSKCGASLLPNHRWAQD